MDKINNIKTELKIETSEELFDIPKQPDEQCPFIDEVIKGLTENSKNVKDVWQNLKDVPEAEDYISNLDWAEYNIRNLESNMEDIRTNATNVRAWGQEWKDFAKQLIEERNSLVDLIAIKHQDKIYFKSLNHDNHNL
jgi:hypothetical protein